MSKADFYRKRHQELKRQESEEWSWLLILRDLAGLAISIAIILAVCILAVPQL